jgi:hypothetical protein
LEQTGIASMKMDRITAEDVDALAFPGGPYHINCALKTLRRMLHKAEEWGLIAKAPTGSAFHDFRPSLAELLQSTRVLDDRRLRMPHPAGLSLVWNRARICACNVATPGDLVDSI